MTANLRAVGGGDGGGGNDDGGGGGGADIKPENLLVNPDHTLKLCDFGDSPYSPSVGRLVFRL